MTSTIPLAALGDDGWRRDRWGRPMMVPPDGSAPVGHTRVTTVAKTLDDGGALGPWKATMAICGAFKRRGLRAQWEALLAEHDGDPWYAGPESKKRCKALVEECATAGGSTDRRDTGTALHRITALADAGCPLPHLSDETTEDLRAYREGLDEAGVTIMSEYIETGVVLDGFRVGGVFDRLSIVPDFTRPLITDLKTGADLSYSWQSIAVQLAAYSRASATYRQGAASDGSEDVRGPMPEVDQDNGLILWLPAGEARLELFLVDLRAGWEAFEESMWARSWRDAYVSMPLDGGGFHRTDLAEDLERSVAALAAEEPAEPTASEPGAEFPNDVSAERPDYLTQMRDWLQGRITVIGDLPLARADLGASWPEGLPTPRSGADLSWEQLAVIEHLLDAVERRHVIPFPPPKPEPVEAVLDAFPNASVINNDEETKQ